MANEQKHAETEIATTDTQTYSGNGIQSPKNDGSSRGVVVMGQPFGFMGFLGSRAWTTICARITFLTWIAYRQGLARRRMPSYAMGTSSSSSFTPLTTERR